VPKVKRVATETLFIPPAIVLPSYCLLSARSSVYCSNIKSQTDVRLDNWSFIWSRP